MAVELWLIRHAQASFGAADYDNLSDLGHRQSRALGAAIAELGFTPDAAWIGAQKRHRQTLDGIMAGMGRQMAPQIHAGWNEFDFTGLLNARFDGQDAPDGIHTDRKTHFRALRDTVLMWQRGAITAPPEDYADFTARVADARAAVRSSGIKRALVVSSGGAIGQTVAQIMDAPADAMIRLQLQVKNCAIARLILSDKGDHLASFNETPHICAATEELLSYS
jgi:broad specificity phosphatase PhoE